MEKKIIVKITPAAVLLVVLVLLAALFLTRGDRRDKQALTIQDTPVIITKIRSLGELTTACYYFPGPNRTHSPRQRWVPWPKDSARTWTTTWSLSPRERSGPAWT